MPKVQIDLPQNIYDKLKQNAKEKYQSLRGYIAYHLIEYITHPEQFINTAGLPENTTIKTITPRTLTPEEEREQRFKKFQNLAKQILGHTLDDIDDYRIVDYNSDNIYYDREVAEPIREGSAIKCVYIYNLPEQKQREYLEEFKHYEDK